MASISKIKLFTVIRCRDETERMKKIVIYFFCYIIIVWQFLFFFFRFFEVSRFRFFEIVFLTIMIIRIIPSHRFCA